MAQQRRVRRKARRGRSQVRRSPSASATAVRTDAKQAMSAQGGLMIGGVQDSAEKAADQVADRVMRMPSAGLRVHRKCAECEGEGKKVKRQANEAEEEETVQAKASPKAAPVASGAGSVSASPGAAGAIRSMGPGTPLARSERAFFEPRMGADLSSVRVHDGPAADKAARGINARAFALGNEVAFAKGERQEGTDSGKRLMAHELAHVAQPGGQVRRQDEDDPAPEPSRVDFNFTAPLPAGHAGATAPRATTDVGGITWSINDGTAVVGAGTSISTNGTITIGGSQAAGTLNVKATNADGVFAHRDLRVSAVPTGISATAFSSDLSNATTAYGAAFQNTFISSDGNASSLDQVRVGERFPGAPTPNAAAHVFRGRGWPFSSTDTLTLHTGRLLNSAAGAWVVDSSGQFGPLGAGSSLMQGDNLSTEKSGINVGNHIQSHSNATPVGPLPVTMTLDQELHWFNELGAVNRRWTSFTTVAHSRTLKSSSGLVEFVTTLNGVEHVQDYEGNTAVFNLSASPANTPKSPAAPPGAPAPAPRTVTLSADALPASLKTGETLSWSIAGAALGCSVTADTADSKLATLTVGTTAGTVVVQVADQSGVNQARVNIRIT